MHCKRKKNCCLRGVNKNEGKRQSQEQNMCENEEGPPALEAVPRWEIPKERTLGEV